MTEKTSRASVEQHNDPIGTEELENAFFDGLRELWRQCQRNSNKHEQARVLIMACIGYGIQSGTRIVGILSHIGMNRQHIGLTLASLCGPKPERHDWWKDAAGHYHLHPDPVQAEAASIVM